MRRKLAAGNWKMNGTSETLAEISALQKLLPANVPEVLICPPAPLLFRAGQIAANTGIRIGAQDCHAETSGAYTGDTSAAMIADTGAAHVIIGHSERRTAHAEQDADIAAKARTAWDAGLTTIICIGEDFETRENGTTLDLIATQLAGSIPDTATAENTVIAYEPIWAIGTGKIPTLPQIIEVHDFIRATLTTRFGTQTADMIPLLYGGSVKPDNAAQIFTAQNVDGALVGGASLKASDFAPIITALTQS